MFPVKRTNYALSVLQLAGFCEYSNKSLGSAKYCKFLKLLRQDSPP
jgi:hypothetical protein